MIYYMVWNCAGNTNEKIKYINMSSTYAHMFTVKQKKAQNVK